MKKSMLAALTIVFGLGIAASAASAGPYVVYKPGAPSVEDILNGFDANR